MKTIKYLSIVILSIFLFTACTTQEEATESPTEVVERTTLSVSGSGSVTPILAAIADDFEAANPTYILEVLAGSGTGGGIRGAIDGTLDLAAMSRPARDSEAEDGIVFVQFGTSVTAVYAHSDVGVSELTGEQTTDIFTGEITNWSEVGGSDIDIIIYVRDPEEGNTVDIRTAFVGEDDFAESAQVLTSQTDMQNLVSTVGGAIGYGTWATALANEADVMALTIDGIGVDNASETLITQMGIGYLADRQDDMQALIDWLLSDDGQAALATVGVAPIVTE